MRYLGNKSRLLPFIDEVIDKHGITGETFVDLFAGTASVADHMKSRFEILANDVMYFSTVIARAKISNSDTPDFRGFVAAFGASPFEVLNKVTTEPGEHSFIHQNYSAIGGRNYFTPENALKIDAIRIFIEDAYRNEVLTENEYNYLLACLIQAVQKVANTSGTYQAFFKFLEPRALKELIITPLEMEAAPLFSSNNRATNFEANLLARRITADIVYIDPPYTTTQYANSYHLLETIARYDNPEIFGKTGRRRNRTLSEFSNKFRAIHEFEDLLRQLQCDHILISYSNQSIIPLDDLVALAERFAEGRKVSVELSSYREYATNNLSYKGGKQGLIEAIIYFRKDRNIAKSPLNYSGSKDEILPQLVPYFPKHISTFVDAMGGAFNVGANVVADSVVYNEFNPRVYEIIKYLLETDRESIVRQVEALRDRFSLTKSGKMAYLEARAAYNNAPDPALLFVLQIYAFQNMLRFNQAGGMNTPVGNNELNEGTKARIRNFAPKTDTVTLVQGSYENIDFDSLDLNALLYFDPPYFLSTAEYNDGKRGYEGWDADKEVALLAFLSGLASKGHRFMLSNLVEHKGRTHHILLDWVSEHGYHMIDIGVTGKKYPRREIIVINYEPQRGML